MPEQSSMPVTAELMRFLERAVTPFHAVQEMTGRLRAAGFSPLAEGDSWELHPGGKYFCTRNGSSLVAFILPGDKSASMGMRMVGAHTDSPCLMVKPAPEKTRHGYAQLAVEVYGGALLNPWFDRDLSLAGRVSYREEADRVKTALVDFRDPVACIPSLAIHLDREANSKRSINPQTDILPILYQAADDEVFSLRELLLQRLHQEHGDCAAQEVLDYELSLYDSQAPALVGLRGDFLASARLDNLLSCYVGLASLLAADGEQGALLACNDHEEVGSLSASGAQGPMLSSILRRIAGNDEALAGLVEGSVMISVDNAHGIHPNFASKHDDNHGPRLNAGPVIKVNNNQRYASNSETAGLWRLLAAETGVPVQSFVVRSDMACGSTIGPITAGNIGVRTLDIGVPTFAMHSIRELAGSADAAGLHKVLTAFYNRPGPLL